MDTKLIKFERAKHPSKITLMLDPKISDMLKKHSKDYNLTMSCIVENLVVKNLGGDSNAITN